LLASVAVAAALWSADGAAAGDGRPIVPLPSASPPAPPPPRPYDPFVPEPSDDGLDRPNVARPYLYTTLETMLVLGVGAVWYLRHGSDERWGRAMELSSWRRRMFTTDEITFDGDHFNTNAVGHPFDGTVYYQIARGNGLGPGGAFISSLLASTFWEYFVEIPENPSLNDMILTPTAGAVIGEATYRLGRYLAQSGTGPSRCAGALLFAPVATLNEGPLCHRRPRLLPRARLGFAAGFNRAIFNGETSRDELALQLGSEVVSNGAYERPGRGNVVVAPGQWTSLRGELRLAPGQIDGAWFHATSVWGGRYQRDYVAVEDDTDVPVGTPARGWGTMLGLGSAFDYRLRDLPQVHDRVGSIGLAGPVFEVSRRGDVYMRLSVSAQYAFAIVGSMAYRENYRTLLGQVIKTSLRDSGYYYGQGLVSAITGSIDLGAVGFMADARGAWYWSINDGDPDQGSIQRDVTLHDSRLYLTGSMWTRPAVGGYRLGLSVEHVRRASHMLDVSMYETELDILGSIAIGF
jgi:hypothetical protein